MAEMKGRATKSPNGLLPEARGIVDRPDERMGIEQQLHFMSIAPSMRRPIRATDSGQRSVPFVHGERHALHPSTVGTVDGGECEHR